MSDTLESQMWEKVQKAYAASKSYRAADDPDFAKALAEFEKIACVVAATNVIPFRLGEARK
jgi:hypothetical protein